MAGGSWNVFLIMWCRNATIDSSLLCSFVCIFFPADLVVQYFSNNEEQSTEGFFFEFLKQQNNI